MAIKELRNIVRLTERLDDSTPVKIRVNDKPVCGLKITDIRIDMLDGEPEELIIDIKHEGQ